MKLIKCKSKNNFKKNLQRRVSFAAGEFGARKQTKSCVKVSIPGISELAPAEIRKTNVNSIVKFTFLLRQFWFPERCVYIFCTIFGHDFLKENQ